MNFRQISLHNFINDSDEKSLENHLILFGDTYSSLHQLPDESIDCAITSPPYWNQRDYGFEGQIGNEPTIEDYIEKLTTTFSILRKKITLKGVFFLNIGDKYLSKYGNTPLGMIPFKLAKSLIEEGWLLQDTLTWYKPNHMPSSVKNRLTNTYEPVFVFVKDQNNYYKNFLQSDDYSNYLEIPLKQNTYKHIATFPEKLINSLIKKLELTNEAIIIDPFAGSGTTTLATKNINKELSKNYSSIAIEAKEEFVNIIKTRCDIQNSNIKKIRFIAQENRNSIIFNPSINGLNIQKNYDVPTIKFNNLLLKIESFDVLDSKDILKIIDKSEFVESIEDNGIFIICLPQLDPVILVTLSLSTKWVVRNIIMRKHEKLCLPLLLLVKDIKSIHYKFNLDAIRQDHFDKSITTWNGDDFLGCKVVKTNSLFKETSEGNIEDILSFNDKFFPELVKVRWKNNS